MIALLAAAGALSPRSLIKSLGLLGVWAIVFAESGLLIGFFLPGDSLLFTAGFFASKPSSIPPELHLDIAPLVVGCVVAAIVGDQVGYAFGRRVGPALYSRPTSRLFKQEHLRKAEEFFERNGAKTIVLARFVPIVRTFAPVVAGVSAMRYRTFVTYNVVGGLLWAVGVTLLGYFLGNVRVVEANLEIAILAIVTVSVTPMALEVLKGVREGRRVRKARRAAAAEPAEPAELEA